MSQDLCVRDDGAEVQVEWRIERFLSLAEEYGFSLHSPSFSLSDAQWFLEISPNIFGNIYLELNKRFSTSKTHSVGYTLDIRRKDGSVFKSVDREGEFEKYGEGRQFPFAHISELRGSENVLSVEGVLRVFATLRLAEPTFLDEDISRAVPLRATHTEEVSFVLDLDFTSLPEKEGFSLDSPSFSFAGAEWCLRVFPNGVNSDYKKWVSLILRRERSSSAKQTVAFTFGIRRSNGTPYRFWHGEEEFGTHEERGCEEFIKSSELLDFGNRLVHQGSVTFSCSFRADTTATPTERCTPMSSDPSHVERASQTEGGEHSQSTCATLHEDYRSFFLKESLGDVTVRVRDQKLPAHRAILAARSSVFTAMFEHDTEERRTGTMNVDDFDPEPFRAFLSFLYSGDVDAVTADNAISLYQAADKYDVLDLRRECLKHLRSALCLSSFCQVAQLAFVHSDQVLLETATEFFVEHAKEIVVTTEWHTMAKEHPDLTTELIIKMVTQRP